jgi:hypothetical protein
MPTHAAEPSPECNKQTFFRENARVVVIDDKCGDLSQPGDMTSAMCRHWAKSSELFHVRDIHGSTPQEKIEDFRVKLLAVVGSDFKNIVVILDRDLGIGKLPLADNVEQSPAARIDDHNDGPALVPHIRKWLQNPPIVGFTGEGDINGMSELYGGARVVQKPDYTKLKDNLVEAFAEAHMERHALREATLPPLTQE